MESEENIDRIIGFKKAFKRNRHALRLIGHGCPKSTVLLYELDLGICEIDCGGSDVALFYDWPSARLSLVANAIGDGDRSGINLPRVSIVSMGQFVGLEIATMDNIGLAGLRTTWQLIEGSISIKVHSLDPDF